MPQRLLKPTLLAIAAFSIPSAPSAPPPPRHLTLSTTRHAPSDLEVTGLIQGLAPGTSAYVSYAQLNTLPQVTTSITADSNFDSPAGANVHVTGIYLDVLAHALNASPQSNLIDALCTDLYRSHFPASYIAIHRPIFALRINGELPSQWAARTHQYDPGFYFITHAHFIPHDHLLSYTEQPQIPDNISRLNFTTAAATYGPITPPAAFATASPIAQGFLIAKQNCLRCHFMQSSGGTKSGKSWLTLAARAHDHPEDFQRYIHNPQSVDPKSTMEGFPTYDPQTLAAITAYFRTFANIPPAGARP